jgi:hypothetical protein
MKKPAPMTYVIVPRTGIERCLTGVAGNPSYKSPGRRRNDYARSVPSCPIPFVSSMHACPEKHSEVSQATRLARALAFHRSV